MVRSGTALWGCSAGVLSMPERRLESFSFRDEGGAGTLRGLKTGGGFLVGTFMGDGAGRGDRGAAAFGGGVGSGTSVFGFSLRTGFGGAGGGRSRVAMSFTERGISSTKILLLGVGRKKSSATRARCPAREMATERPAPFSIPPVASDEANVDQPGAADVVEQLDDVPVGDTAVGPDDDGRVRIGDGQPGEFFP